MSKLTVVGPIPQVKSLALEEWLDRGKTIIKDRPIHYVHKDKSGTTNWFFETGEEFSPTSLLHRYRKSSKFSPNLRATQSKSKERDGFNFLYSKMSGMEIKTLDHIVETRKSSKCKCKKRYPIIDLIDRDFGEQVFICLNCKGTILSRKLKKQR